MFATLSAVTILLSSIVSGQIDDCSTQPKPAYLEAVLQTFDHQNIDSFWIFPDYATNAVLRLKNFGNSFCNIDNINSTMPDWFTIVKFDYDEIVFTVNPTLAQWRAINFGGEESASDDESVGEKNEYVVVLKIQFRGETFKAPITFKKPSAYVTITQPIAATPQPTTFTVTLTSSDQRWDQIDLYRRGQSNQRVVSLDQATFDSNGTIVDGGGDGIKSVAYSPYVYPKDPEVAPDATQFAEYYIHHRTEKWTQFGYYAIAPVRWTQSLNDHYKNPSGEVVQYSHYDELRQEMVLTPNYPHVFEYQILGRPLTEMKELEALAYWREHHGGSDSLPAWVYAQKLYKRDGQTDVHKGKLFGGIGCGEEDMETVCQGKAAKNLLSPKFKNGVDEATLNTVGGIIVLQTFVTTAADEKYPVVSFLRYAVDSSKNPVYTLTMPMGGDKPKTKQTWPVVAGPFGNEYAFGTNDMFKNTEYGKNNVIWMNRVQGMSVALQIQSPKDVVATGEWRLEASHDDTNWPEFVDRRAQVETKFAEIDEPHGLYAMRILDPRGAVKSNRVVKSISVNANPMEAYDQLKFRLVHRNGSRTIVEFELHVEEWDGATKFWTGLFILFATIAAQILSCVYMAKKNNQ
eukprot:365065_1